MFVNSAGLVVEVNHSAQRRDVGNIERQNQRRIAVTGDSDVRARSAYVVGIDTAIHQIRLVGVDAIEGHFVPPFIGSGSIVGSPNFRRMKSIPLGCT